MRPAVLEHEAAQHRIGDPCEIGQRPLDHRHGCPGIGRSSLRQAHAPLKASEAGASQIRWIKPFRWTSGVTPPEKDSLSSRGGNGGLDRLDRRLGLRAVRPARLGEVAPAPPATTTERWRAGLDEAHRVPTIDEILRHADRERRLAIRATRHDGGDAGAELALAFVDQPLELARRHAVEDEAEKRDTADLAPRARAARAGTGDELAAKLGELALEAAPVLDEIGNARGDLFLSDFEPL